MKILFLTKYNDLGASSRIRSMQYFSKFENIESFDITHQYLFGNRYIKSLYSKSRFRIIVALLDYFRRLVFLLFKGRYDLIVVEKELFPYCPSIFESFLYLGSTPYILDYDDAIFHNYDSTSSKLKAFFLKGKLDLLIKNASAVHVGNKYLSDYMLKKCAKSVRFIPTVIDLKKYQSNVCVDKDAGPFVIGWIGSPSTTKYLEIVLPCLEKLSLHFNICLLTIGASKITSTNLKVIQHEWSSKTEVNLLSGISAGIMPLPNEKWEKGKCGYKLIQYMALGKPVIASPVGVNTSIVNNDVGFLCNTEREWMEAIEYLILNGDARINMGGAGYALVNEAYNTDVICEHIVDSFKACVK